MKKSPYQFLSDRLRSYKSYRKDLERYKGSLTEVEKNNLEDKIESIFLNIQSLVEFFPRGSGFDSGTELLIEESTPDKLVFKADFHHMDENGYYCGWTEHKVTVTPEFEGVSVKVSGRNKNEIKDYIADIFHDISHKQLQAVYVVKTGVFDYEEEKRN